MYLLLGSPEDTCCRAVRAALEARGHPVRTVQDPLVQSTRFAWWLESERSASELLWEGENSIGDGDIAGVLVRGAGWIDLGGWEPGDLAYMQAEMYAAMLGWLWSLECPVINRLPPWIWYRPQIPLLAWRPMLRRSGIPVPEMLVTNVHAEAEAFGRGSGAVYSPLSTGSGYLIATDEEWTGLAAIQKRAPVYLTRPHGAVRMACVVGDHVVWDELPTPGLLGLEPALHSFAAAAGLAFVEVALAPMAGDTCAVAVEPSPHLEHYGAAAQQVIVAHLVRLLTGGRLAAPAVESAFVPEESNL